LSFTHQYQENPTEVASEVLISFRFRKCWIEMVNLMVTVTG